MVAAVLVDDLAEPRAVLGARRTSPPALAGRWELPGGKVDRDETPTDGLRRELREELQIEVELGAEVSNPDGGPWPISDRLEMRVWLAQVSDGTPQPTDSHDLTAWLTATTLDSVSWLAADAPIVSSLRALLRS